jgi:hypothetical protein
MLVALVIPILEEVREVYMSAQLGCKPATGSFSLLLKPAPLLLEKEEHKENTIPSSATDSDSFSWEDSQSLTTKLGEKFYENQSDVLELNRSLPRARGIIGDLPAEWRLKLKPDTPMATSRKTIFTAFKQTMAKIREACHFTVKPLYGVHYMLRDVPKDYDFGHQPDVPAEALTQALNETGVTKQKEPITFQFVDEGCFGTIHKFQVNDKTYALKLFKGGTNPLKGFSDLHGSPIEQQRAVFMQQKAPTAPFNKFYFGDIDQDSAYMVTDFVDDSPTDKDKAGAEESGRTIKAKKAKEIDLSPWGLVYGDPRPEGNIRQGKILDYGGIDLVRQPSSKSPGTSDTIGDEVG